jgi:hypothetical protein
MSPFDVTILPLTRWLYFSLLHEWRFLFCSADFLADVFPFS